MFLPCSFWLSDALCLTGRKADAIRLFERLLTLRNDVGLIAEEYDPRERRMLGNFPQALSHVALVNTARNLGQRGGPSEHRSGLHAEPPQATPRHAGDGHSAGRKTDIRPRVTPARLQSSRPRASRRGEP